jgi:hypothetical protein
MARDEFERASGQSATGRNFVPGRCTGRMRQRNYVKAMPGAYDPEFSANYFRQSFAVDELRYSQASEGNDETRLEDLNLIVHPRRAVANLVRGRNAIRAAGILSGKTSADCREINLRADGGLAHRAEFFEPPKKRFASSVRERSLQNRFPRTGRLTNDHDVAHDWAARDRRRFHAWAATALQQLSNMPFELDLFTPRSHQRRKIEKIDKSKLSTMLTMMQVTIGK